MSASIEIPKYHAHMQVWALQVESVGATTFQSIDHTFLAYAYRCRRLVCCCNR